MTGENAAEAAHWIDFYVDTCEVAWDATMIERFRRAAELLRQFNQCETCTTGFTRRYPDAEAVA